MEREVGMRYAVLALAIVFLSGCFPTSPSSQMTSDRAVELARPVVRFEPTTITTRKDTSRGLWVWIVTFRGSPLEGGPVLYEEVAVNPNTGKIVWAVIG
jgi:hypothetical protein